MTKTEAIKVFSPLLKLSVSLNVFSRAQVMIIPTREKRNIKEKQPKIKEVVGGRAEARRGEQAED